MTKDNTYQSNSRRRLVLSLLALLLCVAMFIGATWAWFTDTASNKNNRIVAGDLKVDLLKDKAKDGTYVSIKDGVGDIFAVGETANDTYATLWEPNAAHDAYLAVANKGSLDLKYNIVVNVTDKGLASALEYAIVPFGYTAPTSYYATWADALAASGTQHGDVQGGQIIAAQGGQLTKDQTEYFALFVHMKEDAGNEYQDKEVVIDVQVVATQLASENDSFNNTYDEKASDGQGGMTNLIPAFTSAPVTSGTGTIKSSGAAVDYKVVNVGGTDHYLTATGDTILNDKKEEKTTVTDVTLEAPTPQPTGSESLGEKTTVKVPYGAIDGAAGTISIQQTKTDKPANFTVETSEGSRTYDLEVTGIKASNENKLLVTMGVPKNLTVTKFIHHTASGDVPFTVLTSGEPSVTQAVYDGTAGTMTFETVSFSPFTIVYEAPAAKIGEVEYNALTTALANAKDGETVTLMKDVTEEGLTIGKSITLSGNGNKISATDDALKVDANDVTLDGVKAESAETYGLVVNEGKTGLKIAGGSYVTTTAAKQSEGAIRLLGGNGNVSIIDATLTGGLHVLNYTEGDLTLKGNTFGVDESLKSNGNVVCGILIKGTGAKEKQAKNGDAYLMSTQRVGKIIQKP